MCAYAPPIYHALRAKTSCGLLTDCLHMHTHTLAHSHAQYYISREYANEVQLINNVCHSVRNYYDIHIAVAQLLSLSRITYSRVARACCACAARPLRLPFVWSVCNSNTNRLHTCILIHINTIRCDLFNCVVVYIC